MGWAIVLKEHWFELIQNREHPRGAPFRYDPHDPRRIPRERKNSKSSLRSRPLTGKLWMEFYKNPALHRNSQRKMRILKMTPLTLPEERFVHELILHLRAAFKGASIRHGIR